MNIYAIIIFTTIIITYILGIISEYFNVKNIQIELPKEFEDTYSSEKYKLSQEYLKENTSFGWISGTISLILTLSFWFLGGFGYLYDYVLSLSDSMIIQGIIFIGVLSFLNFIVSLPFSIYDTFVIEKKYGFNTTTSKIFILDIIKSTGISLIIGIPLLALVLYILEYTGSYAWLWGWITLTLFSLFLQYVYPNWIMPIFNKFTPLEEGNLKNIITEYTRKVNFPMKKLFVMDGSKRSKKSNAFFTGFGKNKMIVLYDTLMKEHTEDQILGIIAHEVGHYKKKHILLGTAISIIHTGLLFYLLSLFLYSEQLYEAFYVSSTPIYAGLIFFFLLYSPIEFILSIFMQILSRRNEFQADEFAVQTTGNGMSLVNALKKLSVDNLSNLTPHKFYVFLNYSHPPVLERIMVIKKMSNFVDISN
ncbi:MAG: peptidase M48 [Ignavibacteria bacterium GWF2_33_9]|nr:MAG: peptidase M48 [Ignavibacteria bacterium GWF2_33_9]